MTDLTIIEIAKLAAVITGGGYKRAATKEAAAKRFLAVAAEKGIEDAAKFLGPDYDFATAQHVLFERMKGGHASIAEVQAAEAAELEITDPEALEDAAAFHGKLVANGGTNDGMGQMMPTTNTTTETILNAIATIRAASADALAAAVLNEEPAIAAAAEMLRSGVVPAHRAPRERKPRAEGPNKRQIAADLLKRPEGCTAKEILEATGWPAVSVPAIAKASGLTLRQEKDGRSSRYFGTEA